MGLFAHWICAKDGGDALRDAGFGEIVEAETPGWVIGQPESGAQLPEWEELDETVARVAAAAGGSALGSWIYDNDVGYLVAADGYGTLSRLVVNPRLPTRTTFLSRRVGPMVRSQPSPNGRRGRPTPWTRGRSQRWSAAIDLRRRRRAGLAPRLPE
jgi:hypothetical protein